MFLLAVTARYYLEKYKKVPLLRMKFFKILSGLFSILRFQRPTWSYHTALCFPDQKVFFIINASSMKTCFPFISFVLLNTTLSLCAYTQAPVRVAIAGISHGHASWVFNRKDKTDLEIVGIWEKDTALANRFKARYQLPSKIFYTDLNQMLASTKPAAVAAFGPIDEHLEVVEAAAPRKIHVMVEKPLATTFEDAKHIARLAKENQIKVLTNFETSWYASNAYVHDLYKQGALGDIRRIIVNDGHSGPYAMSKEFVDWLTDPIKNGGRSTLRFRLLRCQSGHLASRWPASPLRYRSYPSESSGPLPEGG